MKSTHLPEVAGDVATVTGSLVLDLPTMGVRSCQCYSATLAATPAAGACFVDAKLSEDKTKLTLAVYDSAYAPSVIATAVAWSALGK